MTDRWQNWAGEWPWEKAEGDTDASYMAFCRYRDAGLHPSLRKAADEYYGDGDRGATAAQLRQMEYWSSGRDWVAPP